MRRTLLCFLLSGVIPANPESAKYLRWPDVQAVIAGLAASGEKLPAFTEAAEWDDWIRARDGAIRGRMERGIEDSISALIVFGVTFTPLPKLASAADAVNAAGNLTPNARARVVAFIQAIDQLDAERFGIVLEYLRKRRISIEELDAFLSGNLRRFALEQAGLPKKHSETLLRTDAGIPVHTTLLINLAVEDTLRSLKSSGALPARVRRVAVIGPGLDLAGDPDANDCCPLQSLQPFAVLEAVARLGPTQPSDIQITAIDMNSIVLSHLRSSLSKARGGQRYVLQLPRTSASGWNAAAVSYWLHFGDTIGGPAEPAVPPPGVELRAISIKPQLIGRFNVEDVDIVAQSLESGQGFDLVIATNVLAYYSRIEQALALSSIARMLGSGGVLVTNGVAPGVKLQDLENLGAHHVAYTDAGIMGDDLVSFRRR